LASLKSQVGACVMYYGVLPTQPDLAKIEAPVLGHFAEHDDWAGPATVGELETKLKDLGKQVEFHTYSGTSHGFFNNTRSEVHDAGASKKTWERTIAFYRKHLV
jgi:carboxymethylenebutenolidase